MNFIVLLKQVPDISYIPPDAWDHEKGILKRNILDNIPNPLDLQALTMAHRMRERYSEKDSKIICLTMGPESALEIILDAISRGADEGILLTDARFAGSDTIATAFSLAQAIRKIEKEIFHNDKNYIIVSGMQSVDGDTAQVPSQIAEEMDINLIAYVFDVQDGYKFRRIGHSGIETLSTKKYPVMITTTDCTDPLYFSFKRTRISHIKENLHRVWNAQDIDVDEKSAGSEGSHTQVIRIFSHKQASYKQCVFLDNMDILVGKISEKLRNGIQEHVEDTEKVYSLEVEKSSRSGEVWVFSETTGRNITPVVFELLGKSRELADCFHEKTGAILLGHNIRDISSELIAYGADKVYAADHPEFARFLSIQYKSVISELIRKHRPQIVLFGATPPGRELAPRIAYSTRSGLTADCIKLEIGDYKENKAILLQTRPALGGNVMATVITKSSHTQMATVRPGVFKTPIPDQSRTGEIIDYSPQIINVDIDISSIEPVEKKTTLSTSKIIVSGGAGLRNSDKFDKYIKPLAIALEKYLRLEAGVGASRRAVEMGIIGREHQVGQTGQTVQPDVYFAVGISGAVQHISGMQKSKLIVAINPDPRAPIFRIADFGILGKAEVIIPRIIEALENV